jgi:hypothetical protein
MSHTPSTNIINHDGRRYFKMTCSCGHAIGTTDSGRTATQMKDEHITTPECPACFHRNVHDDTGCTYVADPLVAVEGLRTCPCDVLITA